MALVLSDGLLYIILMALVSCSCCSYLILWTLFSHDAPLTWSFGGCFHDNVKEFIHCTEDVAHLMQSVGPFDDLTCPMAPPHTPWSLDIGQMSLDVVYTT
jgi:hypothetical protein